MEQPETSSVKVLENCSVSPPPGFFIPQPSLPLTFFDLFWLFLSPVQRLFFYSYHHNTTYFITITLPHIKHSLSLTLQHFYPLAGALIWPPQSTKPEILCDKDSFVSLTIAESTASFEDLVGNHPRDVNDFDSLVPQLTPPNTQVDQVPVTALQVTLFPNTGICIGISTLHVIGDGKTTTHFMKSWASVCKSGLRDTSCLHPETLPFYDRNVIGYPDNLDIVYVRELAKLNITQPCFYHPNISTVQIDMVRATFVLSQVEIQHLKRFVLDKLNGMYNADTTTPPPFHVSTFVVTCAIVWVCLIKVLTIDEGANDKEREGFVFAVDCRERLIPPIPATYFGNCLMPCYLDVKRDDMTGEDGIAFAAQAIGSELQRMISEGVLVQAETAFTKAKHLLSIPRFLSTAGSPKLGVYGTDFGWGMPMKVEIVSLGTNAMSLSECPNGEGEIEIGLVLNKLQMDAFSSVFRNTLNSVIS